MAPAASKAPLEYLLAVAVGVVVIALTPFIKPAMTRWIVLATGVLIVVSCVAAALRPLRSR